MAESVVAAEILFLNLTPGAQANGTGINAGGLQNLNTVVLSKVVLLFNWVDAQ